MEEEKRKALEELYSAQNRNKQANESLISKSNNYAKCVDKLKELEKTEEKIGGITNDGGERIN